MSRSTLVALAAVVAAVALAAWALCAKSPPAPSAPASPQEKVASGTASAVPTKESGEKARDELNAEMNRLGHGLVDSLQRRAYDPRRDGRLEHAEGEVAVRLGGKESTYRFVFDAANKPEEPVKFDAVSSPPDVPADRARRVRQWAILGSCGPFGFVISYLPPTPLVVVPPTDPSSKSFVVLAQPHKSPLSASYSFDDRQVVVARGEWTDERTKAVTNFAWTLWHGRYLLSRSAIVDGAVADFDYDDVQDMKLLSRVRISSVGDVGEAVFTWHDVRRAK